MAKAGVPLGQSLGPRRCSVTLTDQLPWPPHPGDVLGPGSFSLGSSRSSVRKRKDRPISFSGGGSQSWPNPRAGRGQNPALCTQTLLFSLSKGTSKAAATAALEQKNPFSVGREEAGSSLSQPDATSSGHSPGRIHCRNQPGWPQGRKTPASHTPSTSGGKLQA